MTATIGHNNDKCTEENLLHRDRQQQRPPPSIPVSAAESPAMPPWSCRALGGAGPAIVHFEGRSGVEGEVAE
jgi:hypothetical protein